MTTAPDRPSSLIFAVSPRGLFHALRLLFSAAAPIALLVLVILSAVHLLYLRDPARTRNIRYLSVDYMIVLEQLKRAATVVRPDIALIGDSSCLMDVDAARLTARLGRSAESLCSIAYVGPAGYSQLLSTLIERGASPGVLVVILHPAGFQRDPSWESWPTFVRNRGNFSAPPISFPQSALDYIRFELVEHAIYSPLPGRYAIYYGGDLQFSRYVATHRGGAVDPNVGLQVRTLEDAEQAAVVQKGTGTTVDYSMTEQFTEALVPLAAVIKQIGATRVLLAISPVPDSNITSEAELQRAKAASRIAAILGLPSGNILDTPASLPNIYFSSVTHLNRWGRELLTDEVVKLIRERVP